MTVGFLSHLTTSSTLADLPGHRVALSLSERGKAVGDLFLRHPDLPGILLGEEGRFRTAVSRRYYLDAIGRYCGMDLYHPRPISFLMARYHELGGALVLSASMPIAEAVQRGLERRRDFVYEPLVVVDSEQAAPPVAAVRLVDFEDLLAAASRLTSLRAAQMRQILSSVREGLLLIDTERRIAPEYSDAVEEILGRCGLAGQRLPEVLADLLPEDRVDLASDYVATLFNPRVIAALVEKINPLQRVEAKFGAGVKVLSFRFARHQEGNVIDRVLVRVQDVTREDNLERELDRERRRAEEQLQLASALVDVEPPALTRLLAAARDSAAGVLAWWSESGDPSTAEAARLRRELHAVKGDASLLGLQPLTLAVHELEESLARETAAESVTPALDRLREVLDQADVLMRRFAGLRSRLEPSARQPRQKPPSSLSVLLDGAARLTKSLGQELGRAARFIHRVPDGLLADQHIELLRDALAQLVRNALVHGVEAPELRRQAGKPDLATLQLMARSISSGAQIELVFQDDGRGLDEAAIAARASALSDTGGSDASELIFRPGLSTAASAGLHAGRGIGLDVIRQRVQDAGGRVTAHSKPGGYCAFRIVLPVAAAVSA